MLISGRFLSSGLGKIFLGNFLVQITTIFQTIIIARILGPEGKGNFTLIILWPTIIAGFSILGLYTGIAKISAKKMFYEKYNIEKSVLLSTFITGLIGSIVSISICPLVLKKYNYDIIFLAQLFSAFVLANNLARGFVAIDHGRKDFTSYSITRAILNPIFFLFLAILFLINKVNLTYIILSLLAATYIVSIIRIWLGISRRRNNLEVLPVTKLFRYSLKFSISDFAEPIYAYYDKIIVALVLSTYDLGLYTVAYTAAAIISILPTVYATKIFSDIAGGDKIEKMIYSIRQNIALMLLGILGMIIILPIAIPLVFGNDFKLAIIPALVLLITCCLQGQSMIIERSILAKGFPWVGVSAKVITMFSFALLSYILYSVNCIDIYTVVLITIITQSIYLLYLTYQMRKKFKTDLSIMPTWKDIEMIMKNIKKIIKK